MAKQYAEPAVYESKLKKVMERLGVKDYDYNWDRFSCWVEFRYKGQAYKFSHSVENAQAHGVNIKYGSDVFAQVVLSLEDLARMVERGIYDLSTWVAGMKFLPEPSKMPDCFKVLQFQTIPQTEKEITDRFKQLAKSAHPDAGGTDDQFRLISEARDKALEYLKGEKV